MTRKHQGTGWTWGRAWRAALGVLLLVGVVLGHARWRTTEPWGLHAVLGLALAGMVYWIIDGAAAMACGLHRHPREALRWLATRDPWRGLAWRLGVLATLVALFYNVEFWRGRRAWAAVEREATARGDDLDKRGAAREEVPDDENFAMAPGFEPLRRLFAARVDTMDDLIGEDLGPLTRIKEWQEGARGRGGPGQRPALAPWTMGLETDFARWLRYWPGESANERKARGETTAPSARAEAAAEVLRRLGEFDAALEELRVYAERRYCRFPLDYARQMWRDDPVSRVLGGYLRMVGIRATARLATGRTNEALADARLGLRLIDHVRQQPRTIGGLLRQVDQLDAMQPLWEAARAGVWTAGQWQELQGRLVALDLLSDYAMHVRNDAAASADLLEAFLPARRGPSGVPRATRRDPERQGVYDVLRWFYPSGWSLMDQAVGWQAYFQVTSGLVDAAARRVAPWPEDSRVWWRATSDPLFPVFIAPKLRQMGHDAAVGFPMVQTYVDQAVLACALERWRQAKGRYPSRLEELVPEFIDRIPADLMSGHPLVYRASEKGFRLYSIGGNRTDDGGQPGGRQFGGFMDPTSGDWVWDGGGEAFTLR